MSKTDEFCIKTRKFVLKMRNFAFKMRNSAAAVKVAKAHRLGDQGGAIKMQRNMLARRMVASILKGVSTHCSPHRRA